MTSISKEIQQSSFESPRQRVILNILFSAGWAKSNARNTLKPHGITWQQYNVMRILRGQKGEPASMKLLSERMLDKQSNASRLVDKLESKGYIERVVSETDRRQVRVSLTEAGSELLTRASESVRACNESYAPDLSGEELVQLSDLLDRFRAQ